jgi:hypothetical protein
VQGDLALGQDSRDADLEDVVRRFVEKVCGVGPERSVGRALLHEAFAHWCGEKGYDAAAPEAFGKALRRVAPVEWGRANTYVGIDLI